jgi:subtilisin family serine protease
MLAGIIAAVSNNQLGIAGLGSIPIAPAGPAAPVDIPVINPYAIKCNDVVNRPTAAVAAAGMVYAVIQHARVINASWHVLDQGLLYSMISALGSQNPPVLVAAAAGNSGSDNTQIPILPASYRGSVRGKPPLDNLIAVMATDHSDNKCEFSNYGANVDLAAPGGYSQHVDLLCQPAIAAADAGLQSRLPPLQRNLGFGGVRFRRGRVVAGDRRLDAGANPRPARRLGRYDRQSAGCRSEWA